MVFAVFARKLDEKNQQQFFQSFHDSRESLFNFLGQEEQDALDLTKTAIVTRPTKTKRRAKRKPIASLLGVMKEKGSPDAEEAEAKADDLPQAVNDPKTPTFDRRACTLRQPSMEILLIEIDDEDDDASIDLEDLENGSLCSEASTESAPPAMRTHLHISQIINSSREGAAGGLVFKRTSEVNHDHSESSCEDIHILAQLSSDSFKFEVPDVKDGVAAGQGNKWIPVSACDLSYLKERFNEEDDDSDNGDETNKQNRRQKSPTRKSKPRTKRSDLKNDFAAIKAMISLEDGRGSGEKQNMEISSPKKPNTRNRGKSPSKEIKELIHSSQQKYKRSGKTGKGSSTSSSKGAASDLGRTSHHGKTDLGKTSHHGKIAKSGTGRLQTRARRNSIV